MTNIYTHPNQIPGYATDIDSLLTGLVIGSAGLVIYCSANVLLRYRDIPLGWFRPTSQYEEIQPLPPRTTVLLLSAFW